MAQHPLRVLASAWCPGLIERYGQHGDGGSAHRAPGRAALVVA
jgi:hypothetical protein